MKESLPPSPKNFTSILNSLSTFWFKWNLLERCVCVCGGFKSLLEIEKKKTWQTYCIEQLACLSDTLKEIGSFLFFFYMQCILQTCDFWIITYSLLDFFSSCKWMKKKFRISKRKKKSESINQKQKLFFYDQMHTSSKSVDASLRKWTEIL